ncbi:MAG: YdcF family protein [Hyphomicrobiales bacterium]
MYYLLSKILWLLAAPSNLLALIAFFGALLALTSWRRTGLTLAITGSALLLLLGFLPIGRLIVEPLETRFPKWVEDGRPIDGVIVLGGPVAPVQSKAWNTLALGGGAERIIAMADLARRYPSAKVVFTGGVGNLFGAQFTEAGALRANLNELGLAQNRIIFEEDSKNTYENAVFSKKMLSPATGQRWLLVTSAAHMPRSVGLFRKAGFPVEPYPVDWTTAPGEDQAAVNMTVSEGLGSVDVAVREWIGLVAAYCLGQSDTLFPGP